MPYDQFVYAVLTASGSNVENPPASYYKMLRTPDDAMENTTQLFLAVRFNCNKCHDHPFERWTQDQYYHLAAFFAQVGRKEDPAGDGQKLGGTAVEGAQAAGRRHLRHRQRRGHAPAAPASRPRRRSRTRTPTWRRQRPRAASNWPTGSPRRTIRISPRATSIACGAICSASASSSRSTTFAPAIRPRNPELLDRLTEDFIASGFNVQQILRDDLQVAQSISTRSPPTSGTRTTTSTTRTPSPAACRPRCCTTRSTRDRLAEPAAGRAGGLPGRAAARRGADAAERLLRTVRPAGARERLRVRALHRHDARPGHDLVNGPTIADAIADPNNALTKLVATEPDDRKVVEELFLRILSRPATPTEIEAGVQALRGSDEEQAKLVANLQAYEAELDTKQAQWEASQGATAWTPLAPSDMKSANGATFRPSRTVRSWSKGTPPRTSTRSRPRPI